MVDLPIKNGDFPWLCYYVSLPEGIIDNIMGMYPFGINGVRNGEILFLSSVNHHV